MHAKLHAPEQAAARPRKSARSPMLRAGRHLSRCSRPASLQGRLGLDTYAQVRNEEPVPPSPLNQLPRDLETLLKCWPRSQQAYGERRGAGAICSASATASQCGTFHRTGERSLRRARRKPYRPRLPQQRGYAGHGCFRGAVYGLTRAQQLAFSATRMSAGAVGAGPQNIEQQC